MIAAAASLAVVPASAQALSFSPAPTAVPTSLQAGAHSNFNVHISFGNAGDDVKDLTIKLPPGLIGDPNATPLCAVAQLNADSCPGNTKVGSASTSVTLLGLLPDPLPVTGDLYNLTPHAGEPARFGIVLRALPITLPVVGQVLLPPIVLQSGVSVDPATFGLNTTVNGIPNSATLVKLGSALTIPVPIDVTAMNLTLFGTAPGTGKHFMRNPTSCTPHHATFVAKSYSGSTATTPVTAQAAPFTPTGCGSLDFSPSFSAEVGGPGQDANGNPTTAITAIDQDADEAGLLKAKVFIPTSDVAPNLNLFGNTCAPADFQAGSCPTISIVGAALASSPLLTQPLVGNVMLVQSGGTFPNIGLDLKGQLHLLLQGSLGLDSSVTFDGLPDIPIAHFQLAFLPDPGMLLANRDLCAPPAPVFHAEFQGYNGASTAVDSTATVDGCGAGNGATAGKCKKGKKKHKRKAAATQTAAGPSAAASKKHKKHSCKKKKHKKHRK
jgi:hypothetical protein